LIFLKYLKLKNFRAMWRESLVETMERLRAVRVKNPDALVFGQETLGSRCDLAGTGQRAGGWLGLGRLSAAVAPVSDGRKDANKGGDADGFDGGGFTYRDQKESKSEADDESKNSNANRFEKGFHRGGKHER
jgi:hypothetical protein